MIGSLYRVVDGSPEFEGMHRVLWINAQTDAAFTIAVPSLIPSPTNLYFRGPVRRSLGGLRASLAAGDLKPAELQLPGLLLMSDEQISARYPRKANSKTDPLEVRDRYATALKPLLASMERDRYTFFEAGGIAKEIREVEAKGDLRRNQVYSALHRYLALGIGTNGLLPLRYNCGAPGKEREQKNALGNTTAAYKAGLTEDAGFALGSDDKRNLANGWSAFMNGKNSKDDAYNLTMAVYYSEGTHIKDGTELPVLLPSNQRPSFSQFRRWGPKGLGNKEAWETFLRPYEKDSNYRALRGTVLDSVSAVGQLAMCDATPADKHLVSGASRLKPIGSATQLIVQDVYSSMISGIYLGLDAPSGQIALLTVLYSATDNTEECRKYGIEIGCDDIPPIFHSTYLIDNGEFRTKDVIKTLGGLGTSLEYTASYHGDLKGQVESTHRSLNKLEGHKTDGTTRGRPCQRGETAPALKATFRFTEAMRLRLQAVVYYNTEMRVEDFFNRHPLASAMRRDGVPPIRKAIYQWCVQNGYVESPPCNVDKLRAALLPEFDAMVRENGVFLTRPDRGRKVELLYPHRFLGPRATDLNWLEQARRFGTFSIKVRVDPNSLERLWYIDDFGIHELTNVASDIDFVRTATIADSLAIQDEDTENRKLSRSTFEQARTDFVATRSIADDKYRREKQAEIDAQEKPPTKASQTKHFRENREREKERLANESRTDKRPPPQADEVETSRIKESSSDWFDSILAEHRSDEKQ